MARGISRLPFNLCPNLIGSRIRFPSLSIGSKPELPKLNNNKNLIDTTEHTAVEVWSEHELSNKKEKVTRRKVMVAVDSSREAKTALNWALSHTIQPDDTVVLLAVVKPSTIGEHLERNSGAEANQLLHSMKSICQAKRPEVHVGLSVVEAKVRGPAIVEAAKQHQISLLVIGHKKKVFTLRLLMMWAASGKPICDTTEYCVQNATCMALAVRKKSKKGGGFLITTKRLKDFWLLA